MRQIGVYPGTHVTRLALKLMALTFVRTKELIRALRSEFDMEAARWNIPAVRMKDQKPHIVPLSRQALEVLADLGELSGNGEHVFRGERGNKTPSNMTILKGLERMGYKGRMTGTASSAWPPPSSMSRDEHIELQLAHAQRNAVSATYNHALYLEPRAGMMQEWADHLDRIRQNVRTMLLRECIA